MRLGTTLLLAATCAASLSAQPQLLIPLQSPPSKRAAPMALTAPQGEQTEAQKQARAYRGLRLSGRRLSKAVKGVIRELDWQDDLGTAQQAAQRDEKLILWIQALGDLDGFV